MRERIGVLLDGRDHWWEFDEQTDHDALANDLVVVLRRGALPWLDARSGLPKVLDLISREPSALGWEELSFLPKLLADGGLIDASEAVTAKAARRRAANKVGLDA